MFTVGSNLTKSKIDVQENAFQTKIIIYNWFTTK